MFGGYAARNHQKEESNPNLSVSKAMHLNIITFCVYESWAKNPILKNRIFTQPNGMNERPFPSLKRKEV